MRATRSTPPFRRSGVALVIMTLAIFVIGPLIGLAIDVGILYLLKARLSQAADAAGLAGARSLSRGSTLDSQRANALSVSQRFFDANFPDGYWGTRNRTRTMTLDETQLKLRILTVTAQVEAPLYFLRLLNHEWATLHVTAEARRRDVNVLLVLDRSGSMANSHSCELMKEAAQAFVGYFSEGRDRLGLVTYSTSWYLGYAPSQTFKSSSPSLDSVLADIYCVGGTSAAMALSEAYNQLVAINEQGALNIIVFFTDGVPTALTATVPIKTISDTRYGDGENNYRETRTLYTMTKSACYDAAGRNNSNQYWAPQDRLGVLIAAGTGTDATGTTYGIYQTYASSVSDQTDDIISGSISGNTSSTGCYFATNATYVRHDVAYIPNYDYYTNQLNCCYRSMSGLTFTSGTYAGYIRPDKPSSVGAAAVNATDSAATRIRSDTTYTPVIYAIGLGDIDETLLKKVANDTSSASYNSAQPTGLYLHVTSADQLKSAFLRVASEILRLAL